MAKLSVNLVVYSPKEAKYIPYLFDSLKKQTFQDFEFLLIDNGAGEELVAQIEDELKQTGKAYRIIHNGSNLGFANGHNIGYKNTKSEYVLLQNPDMYIMPDTLEKMVTFLDKHQDVVAVSPRLMHWDFEKVQAVAREKGMSEAAPSAGFTSTIDAIGIRLFRNRRAVEWLTRQTWAKDSDSPEVRRIYDKKVLEVFGVSGAFPLYRKAAIDKYLLTDRNLFDPQYHSYKEDLDLAYRLRNYGHTSYVILDAIAYHDRTGAGPKKLHDWAAIRNKKKQSGYVRVHSYKNHLLTLYKNEYWQNFLLDFPFIFWYELKKFVYLLFFNPAVFFSAWGQILKHCGAFRKEKKQVHRQRKMHWRGIRRWFSV